jgi:hypothetical protein
MSWERIPGTDGEFSGDDAWDAFSDALTKIASAYQGRFHRCPTVRELHRGLYFVLRGAPERYVVDPEQLEASPPPPRRWLFADDFEAASGDMRGDVEPVFISRRATGGDVVRFAVVKDGRTLRCGYDVLDEMLSEHDARWLFIASYLKTLTGDHYADQVDIVSFHPLARPSDRVEIPYPR